VLALAFLGPVSVSPWPQRRWWPPHRHGARFTAGLRRRAGPMRSAGTIRTLPPLRDSRRAPTSRSPSPTMPAHSRGGGRQRGRCPVQERASRPPGAAPPRAPSAAGGAGRHRSHRHVEVAVAGMRPVRHDSEAVLTVIHVPDRVQSVSRSGSTRYGVPRHRQADVQALTDISSELFLPNLNFIFFRTASRSSRQTEVIDPTWFGLNTSSRASCCGASTHRSAGPYFRQFWTCARRESGLGSMPTR